MERRPRTPDDYVPSTGMLVFDPEETSKTITGEIRGNRLKEVDGPSVVLEEPPAQCHLERPQGFQTILDDERMGQGYWVVAPDGGSFACGDPGFSGSAGSLRLNRPIVGIAASPTGKGTARWQLTAGSSASGTPASSPPPETSDSTSRSSG